MHGLPQPTTSTRAMREKFVEQQEQLRELLEYCKGMSDGNESGDAREAYDDAATKLRAILDGE